MRKSIRRGGALWLTLLLQVFVLSGFVHPCCLGGMDGMQGSHAGTHGEAAPNHHDHHGGDDHHGGMDHGVHASDAAAEDGATHQVPQPDEDAHECPGCDGTCALCCQTPGSDVLAPGVSSDHAVDGPTLMVGPAPSPKVFFLRAPAHLLPFANGPPLSPVANG